MLSNELTGALMTVPDSCSVGPRSIVVALDGEPDSDSAVACAAQLGRMTQARIHVVSVAEPRVHDTAYRAFMGETPVMLPDISGESIRAAQLQRVRQQLERTGEHGEWTVSMRNGLMSDEVTHFASSVNADVIMCGRGRHRLLDRILGEEHLARLLRTTRVPVLAAEPTFVPPARRVIIAADFSEENIATATTALPYIADSASVYLVHVQPDPPFGLPHPGRWIRSYENGVRAGLEHLQRQIPFSPFATIEPIVLHGHPGVALADFAAASRSDLLVVGSHGAGFWNRLVIGSVTTYLLRESPTSLLVVPKA